jgi:hypothetical protein
MWPAKYPCCVVRHISILKSNREAEDCSMDVIDHSPLWRALSKEHHVFVDIHCADQGQQEQNCRQQSSRIGLQPETMTDCYCNSTNEGNCVIRTPALMIFKGLSLLAFFLSS